MYKETNLRSITKGLSWRLFATFTTIVIVYAFFGRLDLAIFAGVLESAVKIVLFWIHERVWIKVRWGKKKIKPFSLWLTGLPCSGKSAIADEVLLQLEKFDIPLERLDSKDIRSVIPNIGYERDDRSRHLLRVAHLIKTLQGNSISTISSFVSPYQESRQAIGQMVQNHILVFIKTDLATCKQRDKANKYERAIKGEILNFTGISDVYEEPQDANIVIDGTSNSIEASAREIVKYIQRNLIE